MKQTWNNIIYLLIFFTYLFGAPLMICQSDTIDVLFTGIRQGKPEGQNLNTPEDAIDCSEFSYTESSPCISISPQLFTGEEQFVIIRNKLLTSEQHNLNARFNNSPITKEQLFQDHLLSTIIQSDTIKNRRP